MAVRAGLGRDVGVVKPAVQPRPPPGPGHVTDGVQMPVIYDVGRPSMSANVA